jgi:hypothetical protein
VKLAITILAAALLGDSVHAQGTFQNLNFELADPGTGTTAFNIPVANALPYWAVTIGGVQRTEINYNATSTGSTAVTLVSTADSVFPAIDGNYSVLLQGGITASAASISQTGIIPAGTESLMFEAQPDVGTFQVFVGGQNVPFSALGLGPNYTLYGANISAWAGDTEQLTFSAMEGGQGVGLNNWVLDDISFSPTGVPEPDPFILTGLGGTLFALCRLFAPKRCS